MLEGAGGGMRLRCEGAHGLRQRPSVSKLNFGMLAWPSMCRDLQGKTRLLLPLIPDGVHGHGWHLPLFVIMCCILDVLWLLWRSQPLRGRHHRRATAHGVHSLPIGEREQALFSMARLTSMGGLELLCLGLVIVEIDVVDQVEGLLMQLNVTIVLIILLQADADLMDVLEGLGPVKGLAV